MAPSGRKDATAQEQEQDLGTILTTEERVELTLLVANIAEIMRKHIQDTFDASLDTTKTQQPPILAVQDKPSNLDQSNHHMETDEEENARKLRVKREKDLSKPKVLEMKQESLAFFDRWRESVISRVGAVVNNPKEVMREQAEKASIEATREIASEPEPKVIREQSPSPYQ